MSDQVVSVSFDKESLARRSVSLSAFVITAPFARELPSKAYKRQGSVQAFPASLHPEINGTLYMDTVRVPDGVIMAVQVSHKMLASPVLDAAILLRTRSTGPSLAIHASLPTSPEALVTGQFLVFQGRADRLTYEEAVAAGIEIPRHWAAAFLDKEEVAEAYLVTELSPELVARPRLELMQDADGEEVLVAARPGRRLRSRR